MKAPLTSWFDLASPCAYCAPPRLAEAHDDAPQIGWRLSNAPASEQI